MAQIAKCDNCGTETPGHRTPYGVELPEGWITLTTRHEKELDEKLEVCSWECAHEHAQQLLIAAHEDRQAQARQDAIELDTIGSAPERLGGGLSTFAQETGIPLDKDEVF
jgi:hypothetical protein